MDKPFDFVEEAYSRLTGMEKQEFLNAYIEANLEGHLSPNVYLLLKQILQKEERIKMDKKEKTEKKEAIEGQIVPSKPAETEKVPTEAKALVVREEKHGLTMKETMELGEVLYKANYFTDARSAAQAVVKILAGRELGLPPIISMSKVYVVKGRTSIEAEIMADLIKRTKRETPDSWYDFLIVKADIKGCTLQFFYNGKPIKDAYDGKVSFTEEDARRAELLKKDNYRHHPEEMYYCRAIAKGARRYCPHLLHGAYTRDELDFEIDKSGKVVGAGEPIKITGQKIVDEPEVVISPRAKEIEGLKEKYGLAKLKEAKAKLKISTGRGQLEKVDEAIWKKFLAELETKKEPEKKKEKEKAKDKTRIEEIAELKEKYGLKKLKAIRDTMGIPNVKGSIDKLDEKAFKEFKKAVEK